MAIIILIFFISVGLIFQDNGVRISNTESTSKYISLSNFALTTNGITFISTFNTTTGKWARLFDFGNGSGSDNIIFSPSNGLGVYLLYILLQFYAIVFL